MDLKNRSDEFYMKEALKEARKALEKDEVPIGAVIVCHDRIVSRAHNLTETLTDVTAHAEMQAITAASAYLGGKYLNECTLYVTLEPCVMCAGATYWTQIGKIVFGAYDPKRGYSIYSASFLHPRTKVKGGVNEKECGAIISDFFHKKRENNQL
ncbi:MAG: nucleoside deaminase [Chlorobi bacterium]|nr:nucleoside deaminase [Chlorobiota bacterium]